MERLRRWCCRFLGAAAVGGVVGVSGWLLAAEPKPAPHAQPAPEATPAKPGELDTRIAQLITQLGDKEYAVRQRAQDELAQLGLRAFDALSAAAEHEDFEIASRARYLLRLIRSRWVTEHDPGEARELLERYELLSTDERTARIARLVRLPQAGGLPAVCRLIRFEKLSWVSAFAALEIMYREPLDSAGWARWARVLQDNLAGSGRAPARWLLGSVHLREDPKAAWEPWSKLVEEQQEALRSGAEHGRLGVAALLAYRLAEAHQRLGNHDQASQTAERARNLRAGTEPVELRARLRIASNLRRRGHFAWAEAEYRQIALLAPVVFKVFALVDLSEMLHDRGQHLRAAEVRQEALDAIEQLPPAQREEARHSIASYDYEPSDILARKNYFLACHWREQGDVAKQRQYLHEAVRAHAFEVDSLIALWHLPDQSPAERTRTEGLVHKAVDMLRREVELSPGEADVYNQLAWLMGNTQVDLEEALKLAQQAVAMDPDNGAFLDTLAHVYYAKGDLEQAIRYQARAVEVEPHSGLIQSELKVFRAALEQRRAQPKAAPAPHSKQ